MLGAERRECVLDPPPLVEKRVAEVLGVDARHRLSFRPRPEPATEARRRSISAGPIPVSSTIFSRPPWPETRVTAVRGSASVSASRRSTASLARPRSGASVTRIFHASPCLPTSAVRPAPGLTRSRSRVVSAVTDEVYVRLLLTQRLHPGRRSRSGSRTSCAPPPRPRPLPWHPREPRPSRRRQPARHLRAR